MNDKKQLNACDIRDNCSPPYVNKGKLDLIILRYMAKRIQVTLHLANRQINASQPLLYVAKERRGRTHRVAIYDSQDLLRANSLPFVGFVSGQRKPAITSIVDEIHAVDARLVVELANIPGILSYSSLELHEGYWYNLVLLSCAGAKMHIQKTSAHAYASYQLSPYYYEWIRIHNGVMPEGLANNEMKLQKTKYYTFQDSHQRPTILELNYGA
jgi:hypothetical protein